MHIYRCISRLENSWSQDIFVNICTTYDHIDWKLYGINEKQNCLIQESIALTFNLSMEENRNILSNFYPSVVVATGLRIN